jgi:tetratricopeptide (TPR) repeat protein
MKKTASVLLLTAAALTGCMAYHPDPALDLYLKGQLEAQKGDLPRALDSLTEAIRKNPRMGTALLARGDIYKDMGNYDAAAADYSQLVKNEPYNFSANFKLGVVYQYLKKYADAIVAYQRSVEIRPFDREANMNLAMAYVQTGEPLRGLPYAQRAVQGDDNSATAHANLGMLYSQIGYRTAAIDELKRSLELDSKQTEVYANLAQEYLYDKRYDQARNVLETAQTIAPSAKIWDRLGFTYHMLRDEPKAEHAFRQALRIDPRYYPSLNGLGVIAMSKALAATPTSVELAKEAIDYWNQSLALDPKQDSIRQLVNTYAPQQ